MKNNFYKIIYILSILSFLILFTNVDALDVGSKVSISNEDGNWIVKGKNNLGKDDSCNINKPSEPKTLHIVGNFFPTIGLTYENTCKEGYWATYTTCTQAAQAKTILDNIQNAADNSFPNNDGSGINNDNAGGITSSFNDKSNTIDVIINPYNNMSTSNLDNFNENYNKLLSVTNKTDNVVSEENFTINKNSNVDLINPNEYIQRTTTDDQFNISEGENAEFVASLANLSPIIGVSPSTASKINAAGFYISHFSSCTGYKYRTCKKECCETCSSSYEYDGQVYSYTYSCNCTVCYDYVYGKIESEQNFKDPGSCSSTSKEDFDAILSEPAACSGGEDQGVTIVSYCYNPWYRSTITASKFVCKSVGPTKVEVFGNKLTINEMESYCVTPSAGYNKSYKWDKRFDATNCKNSMQTYNSDRTISFSTDCGYAYILAEAKRINAEEGKEIFSYGVISTAMRLFGTGITTSDKSLSEITGKEYLRSGGYYATYRGWGYGEYVGIPWVRPEKPASWPAIYRYFMPEFYSIYIRTAKVATSYLKDNIRYSDIGKLKDTNGNIINDPMYYLKPLECKENFKNCNDSDTNLLYNDGYSSDKVDAYFPNDGGLTDFLTSGGKKASCKDESGLGVMCGLANEEGNAEYLKSIFLYIKALQGNEIVFEKDIEQASGEYSPIKGLTKILYNVDDAGDTSLIIRYAIDTQTRSDEREVDCDVNDESTKAYCRANVFVFDSKGNQVLNKDYYDYCKKNYCYVEVKGSMICKTNGEDSNLSSVVVTNPDIKSTIIKKINNGQSGEQVIFVYDNSSKVNGGFCQEIDAVKESIKVECPCDPKEKSNVVEANGNIKTKNYCSNNYNSYDELYYGDPSMSTILNACYEEDKLKYDYTKDLNINGNDIAYEAELAQNKYSYQVKSDDFEVCKLYCRDETRFMLANKLSVRAGMHLQYDIGMALINNKILNETAKNKGVNDTISRAEANEHYMPSVVLQLRECTSVIDYDKWENLYKSASSTKEKNQLLYSIYNCNLYTNNQIKNKVGQVFDGKTSEYKANVKYAESAMIEYSYSTDTGKVSIDKDWGTTKDYLMQQEGCTSLGLNQTECANYFLTGYEKKYIANKKLVRDNAKTYYDEFSIGSTSDYEHGLVDSNLNKTIYCTGQSCYKKKGADGKYYYNPTATNKNSYLNVEESGNILSYNDWGRIMDDLSIDDKEHNLVKSKTKKIDGITVPTNEYASFIIVTETGFYNAQQYYGQSFTGKITTEPIENSTELDKNILPLHLDNDTGSDEISYQFTNTKTAYKRNNYYTEKNYSLFDKINAKPGPFEYICSYDVYNTTTKYEKGLGFTYRIVNLSDMFESVTNEKRDMPENWNTEIGKSALSQITNSYNDILEKEGDGDTDYSYLEYSFTLTPEGINRIRNYNKEQKTADGYLNNTLSECQYDEEEQIFYNCKSSFLTDLTTLNGRYSGLITINKSDGLSEFCEAKGNKDEVFCKY